MSTGVALVHMSAESRRTAGDVMTQDFFLGRRGSVLTTIVIPVGTDHIGDLELRSHGVGLRSAEDAGVRRAKEVEWAARPSPMLDADVSVDLGGPQRAVPQESLHERQIRTGLQEVRGKAVA